MDLFTFIFWLTVLWLCIHALPHTLSRLFPHSSIFRSSSPPLPLTSASASRRSHKKTALESNWKSRHWTVHVSKLHFRISSTLLNDWHEALFRSSSHYAGSGTKQGNEHRRRLTTLFYDLGSISGAVGMILCLLGLVWTCWVLGQSVWGPHPGRHVSDGSNPNSGSVHYLTKRHMASLDLSPSTATGATSSHLQLALLVRSTILCILSLFLQF